MTSEWQTWTALAVVVVTVALLVRSWWRRRGDEHGGCDCPGSRAGREVRSLKNRSSR